MSEFKLKAKKRNEVGKNKVDKLRDEKLIPGVIYEKGKENENLTLDAKEFDKVYFSAGMSNIIDLEVEGSSSRPALIKEVQKHPYKNQFLHIDFVGVNMSEKMRVAIPVVLEGRDSIRVQPSVLMQLINEVEVECLPADLPSEAIVNVEDMQIDQTIEVKDLDIFKDEKIEILVDPSEVVATLSEPKEEVIEETEEVDASDVPTVEQTEEAKEDKE